MQYVVKRQHFGDKQYYAGDIREADPRDVAHLIKSGVLEEKNSNQTILNKAEKPAKNKGA
ncbi:hypothetical protein H3S90_07965 [Bartonella sp. W8097]|uniref:hypothetical protein n=1 Tax=Bartonella TaxID=773 RepID=UPI00095B9C65|nr:MULTISPECIES: hypothetical protein [Bartonella]MBI0021019.1 hypothetical protein [Bartonella apihabitans]OLY45095.1 hypothetical protein PEB0150_017940 [Bartonella apis]